MNCISASGMIVAVFLVLASITCMHRDRFSAWYEGGCRMAVADISGRDPNLVRNCSAALAGDFNREPP